MLNCIYNLYILDVNFSLSFSVFLSLSLYIYIICKYFLLKIYIIYKYLLLICRLPFHFLDSFLHCAKALYLDVVLFVYFCFGFPCLRRQIPPPQILRKLILPMFFLGVVWSYRSYSKVSKQVWVYFCIWGDKLVQFDSSACTCPVFPIPFIENSVYSPLYILASFFVD